MTTTNPILLAYQPSSEELNLQKSDEIRNYKNKKNQLKTIDKLDLWDTTLYQTRINDTLDATKAVTDQVKEQKKQTKYLLFDTLMQSDPLNAE